MNITVLLGGDSPERDVSLASGREIIHTLRERGHQVVPLDPALPPETSLNLEKIGIGTAPPGKVPGMDPGRAFEWLTSPAVMKADVVFIALHGGRGEDGTIQALLESAGAVYTGAGVLGSALAMNKDRSKALMSEAGVPTARHLLLRAASGASDDQLEKKVTAQMGFPVVVKPNSQGSSVGFSFVEHPEDLPEAVAAASEFEDDIIVEKYIPGRELTVSILGEEALPPVEIVPEGGFYNYKCKYTKGCSRYIVPAEISSSCRRRLEEAALAAFGALCCRDYARVDFRLDERENPFCLELNTLPGMTGLSLVPMAAAENGIEFGQLVERICWIARERSGNLIT
ncbi:MAG: D-alanine--D-alanine ligase [Candidatus Latescibacteria bacterium]|nr:D-alanine--D-alanine ligase [bacterium]MBD3423492.1 D-alanine--D-alanine ligase [Candidatus Latescibacterota bacterium]